MESECENVSRYENVDMSIAGLGFIQTAANEPAPGGEIKCTIVSPSTSALVSDARV